MEEETKKLVNEKIRELINSDSPIEFNKAIDLLKALNNPSEYK